ncbi:hypothetical protein OY671_008999, partial [Metschnikowia pulcherrima]
NFRSGARAGFTATGGTITGGPASAAPAAATAGGSASAGASAQPEWAAAMKRRQAVSHGATVLAHTMKAGDSHGGGAAQQWDDRIGSARVQAKNWRLAFFGASALSGGLSAGLVWQSARGHIVPWVVQVDRLGEAQAAAPAEAGYPPTDPQIAFHPARPIEHVRAIPAHPVLLRQNWSRAHGLTTDRPAGAPHDPARAPHPL